jgi:hypothetical protein
MQMLAPCNRRDGLEDCVVAIIGWNFFGLPRLVASFLQGQGVVFGRLGVGCRLHLRSTQALINVGSVDFQRIRKAILSTLICIVSA